jgi:uncharacterized damage-inducible protein DinB
VTRAVKAGKRAGEQRIALLLETAEFAFGRRGWHGTTLSRAVAGLKVEAARRRPGPGRHSIWELVLHLAYWKSMVRRRLTEDRSIVFPRRGANWPELPKPADPAAWRADVSLLRAEHRLLVETIASFPPRRLDRRTRGSRWTNAQQIHGIIAHDLYHTGQIQLIKALQA